LSLKEWIELQQSTYPTLKTICEKCILAGSGFDPSLITQHVEKIALDRFNKIVLDELNELNIPELMAIRHEMELLMLNERYEHYTNEVEKINKLLIQDVTGVSLESSGSEIVKQDLENVTSISNVASIKKGKKK
jgi:hypothetical protein